MAGTVAQMPKDKPHEHVQYGALPWRIEDNGRLQIMLLTSRETRRWVIPKGWPMKGKKGREVAAQEIFEEAGLLGQIVGKRPIGIYHYSKQRPTGSTLCQVRVYLFRVEEVLDIWPEMGERTRQWFEPQEAAQQVVEGGLAEIIENFGAYRVA
jgi:8-oxo-dGTP pyrophosphatase MutT (NUDIX family)